MIVAQLRTDTYINQLKIAEGSSWDPQMTCLRGTRDEIISDLIEFAFLPPQLGAPDPSLSNGESPPVVTPVIQVVTGVLGCGKSAIAHSVAEICEKAGILGASFMFKRGIKDRESPDLLMSTIARSLCAHWRHSAFPSAVAEAIENSPTILSPPISQQFRSLLLRPIQAVSASLSRPVVIVIDALDEGCDDKSSMHLLDLLAHQAAMMPPMIRMIITTRPTQRVMEYVGVPPPHICVREIDLSATSNKDDVECFVRDSLRKTAARKHLGAWPGKESIQLLIDKAGGLFIWASTACEFIAQASNPKDQLEQFIDARSEDNGLDDKMVQLYTTVLDGCPWRTDRSFAKSYPLLLGTILTLKTPLSPHAIKSLLVLPDNFSVMDALRPLSPVLMGVTEVRDGNTPLQVLHDSFRGFATGIDADPLSAKDLRYKINVVEHNERLVLAVVELLNRELLRFKPALDGIISTISEKESHGVPGPPDDITEALWYCCQYLPSHLSTITEPSGQLVGALSGFMQTGVSLWIVLCSSKGSFPEISAIPKWCMVCIIHTFIGV